MEFLGPGSSTPNSGGSFESGRSRYLTQRRKGTESVSVTGLDALMNPTHSVFSLNKLHLRYTMYYKFVEVVMLAIRLEKDLEQEIDLLAKSKGSNRSTIVREAIVRYLEDNEDLELAKQALEETRNSKSLKELRKDLGLDN